MSRKLVNQCKCYRSDVLWAWHTGPITTVVGVQYQKLDSPMGSIHLLSTREWMERTLMDESGLRQIEAGN